MTIDTTEHRPGRRRPVATTVLAALLLAVAPFAGADTLRLANGRTLPFVFLDGHRYAALDALSTALDLEHEFSDDAQVYTLLTPDQRNGATVSFTPGRRKFTVNREERFMPVPPLQRSGTVYLPVDTILAVLRVPLAPDEDAAASRLSEVTFSPFLDFTRLQFVFSSPAEAVTTTTADGTAVVVTFPGASLDRAAREVPVNTAQVANVAFTPTSTGLVGRVAVRCKPLTEVFSLESGRRLIIDVIDGDARRGNVTQDKKDFFASCHVLLDAGHGGADTGCTLSSQQTEKWFTLGMAKSLAATLQKAGFEVVLSRTADVDLPLLARVDAINAAAPDVVLSLHASAPPLGLAADPLATVIVLRKDPPLPAGAPVAPDAAERGCYAPTPEEIRSAHNLAGLLLRKLQAVPTLRATLLDLPAVVPLTRAMAPSLLLDIANIADRPDAERAKLRAAILEATTGAVVDYFDEMFLTRSPDALDVSQPPMPVQTPPIAVPAVPTPTVPPPRPAHDDTPSANYTPRSGTIFDPEEFLGPEPTDDMPGDDR